MIGETSFSLLPFERVDEVDGREEPNPFVMMLDGLDADCVAMCVLPVRGPPTRTMLLALSRNLQQ